MNENLDLTKILYRCPKGTEFYNTVYGKIKFFCIDFTKNQPIIVSTCDGFIMGIAKDGKLISTRDGECTLFPSKDQRDWSKFERFWDKPKVEKFDIKTLQPFDKVLVRDHDYVAWSICWFSHMGYGVYANRAICDGMTWNQCIPYNEETKHLVGTNNDCPNYYKWWENRYESN